MNPEPYAQVQAALKDVSKEVRESLEAMLPLLAAAATDPTVPDQLRQRLVEAPEPEASAYENAVVEVLETDWEHRAEQEQAAVDRILKDLGTSVMSTKPDLEKKMKHLVGVIKCEVAHIPSNLNVSVDAINFLMQQNASPEAAAKLKILLRAKIAFQIVSFVVVNQAKMFSFQGGFQGFAWSVALAKIAEHGGEEGQELLHFIGLLIASDCPQVCPTPVLDTGTWEGLERLNINKAERKGVAHLFACLATNEELPLPAAQRLAEAVIGAGAGAQMVAFQANDGRALVNVATTLRLWVDAYCMRPELQAAKARLESGAGGGGVLQAAITSLDHGAEAMAVVMAVAGRVWDQKYRQPRRTAGGAVVLSGFALADQNCAIRDHISQQIRGMFGSAAVQNAIQQGALVPTPSTQP
ncbi:hypothetical protein T484DRAFT_3069459 [Baffinella frigidus]|nr:hypothetical protein T484DRAFT_3069459 [Cryptophyta sp. CCMP2293]